VHDVWRLPKDLPCGRRSARHLRTKDYYHDQLGDLETAVSTYAAVPAAQTGSAACRDCTKCEQVCSNGVHIVERLEAARSLFAV
jgi:predicted aldo/keto reductase-like oxidoreductase